MTVFPERELTLSFLANASSFLVSPTRTQPCDRGIGIHDSQPVVKGTPRSSTNPRYHDIASPCVLAVSALPLRPAVKVPTGVQFFSSCVLQGSSLVLGRPLPLEMGCGSSVVPSLQVTVSSWADRSTSILVIQRFSGGCLAPPVLPPACVGLAEGTSGPATSTGSSPAPEDAPTTGTSPSRTSPGSGSSAATAPVSSSSWRARRAAGAAASGTGLGAGRAASTTELAAARASRSAGSLARPTSVGAAPAAARCWTTWASSWASRRRPSGPAGAYAPAPKTMWRPA